MKQVLKGAMLSLLLVSLAQGQETREGKGTYLMDPVLVTATKDLQPEKVITQKVDVVYDEEFEQYVFSNRNISEILKYQPGNFVNVLSRNDANWGSYGGLGPKYNVQLLDGLPIDSFVDGMSLDPWAFDRVEVHRGPAAVMYSNYLTQDFSGNEAPLAGIANFVLRDKVDDPRSRIALGYGSYNTRNGRFYHQGKGGDFHYFFGGNYEQSDYTNYGTPNSWLNMIDDPEYKKTKLYLKTTYFFKPDGHKLSLFVHHTDHRGDAGRPNRDYDHTYDTVNAVYQNQLASWLNVQLKAGWRGYDRTWNEDNYPTNLALREHAGVTQDIFPADLTFTLKHWDNSALTFGADYQFAHYETFSEVSGVRTKGNDSDASNVGIFAQENFVLSDWVFRLGGRFNYTKYEYDLLGGSVPEVRDKSWDKILWSAGIKYNATERLAFYTNAGSSFLTPSAKSVGGTLLASDFGVSGKNGQLPNPDLQPESGIGTDLGSTYRITGTFQVGIRGFYNVVDDAIVENRVSLDPSQTKSVNAGKARSYGAELEVKHQLKKYLQWFATFTYTDTKIENGVDPDQDGADVPFVPNYVANLGITLDLPWDIKISPYLHAVGEYYDSSSKSGRLQFGPYEVVDLMIQKGLFTGESYRMNLNIELHNLFNRKFEMPWQFQNPGFEAMARIELNL
jgi:outer membrane receptor protein involved in Fe transport